MRKETEVVVELTRVDGSTDVELPPVGTHKEVMESFGPNQFGRLVEEFLQKNMDAWELLREISGGLRFELLHALVDFHSINQLAILFVGKADGNVFLAQEALEAGAEAIHTEQAAAQYRQRRRAAANIRGR